MAYRLMGRLHAWALALRGETGQGTVEYVGLLLLIGALLAAVIAAMHSHNWGLAEVIVGKLKAAIDKVSQASGKG